MNLNNLSQNKGLEAMKAASMIAEENGIAYITLDDINAKIAETRKSVRYWRIIPVLNLIKKLSANIELF